MSDSSWCMHLRRPLSTLLSASLVLLMWSMGVCAPASSQRPPNIVLIVSDDQGWRDARCLGREEMVTPNLDRLASEGFEQPAFMLRGLLVRHRGEAYSRDAILNAMDYTIWSAMTWSITVISLRLMNTLSHLK